MNKQYTKFLTAQLATLNTALARKPRPVMPADFVVPPSKIVVIHGVKS